MTEKSIFYGFNRVKQKWVMKSTETFFILRKVQRRVQIKNFEVRFSAVGLRFYDDSYLYRLKNDWSWRHSFFESDYAFLRDWFQKWNSFLSELPLNDMYSRVLCLFRDHSNLYNKQKVVFVYPIANEVSLWIIFKKAHIKSTSKWNQPRWSNNLW